MGSSELDSLVRVGKLKTEPPTQIEIDGLKMSGNKRLKDAHSTALAIESRFDLAYSAGSKYSQPLSAPSER